MTSFLIKLSNSLGIMGSQNANQAYKLICSVTLLRIVYLFIFPLGLVGDESYYWEWGRNMDWGYYSKPPMIGWLMGILIWLGIDGAAELRTLAALFGGFTMILFYQLGTKLFDKKIAFWAMVFLLLTPAISAVSLIITIDAPLLFFWTLSMLAFWVVFYERSSIAWIIILIFSLGLGNLTKQMMLLFPLLGGITLFLDHQKRYFLIKPWFWGGWLLTLTFLLPPIIWNWSNDWITLKHTASHINHSQFSLNERILSFLEFVISESFILGPILFGGGLYTLFKISKSKKRKPSINFLLIFSMPAIFLFLILSFTQKVNPNWPAVFYLPMILLCAYQVSGKLKKGSIVWWKDYKTINLISAILLLGVLYLSVFSIELFGLSGSKYDLFKRLRGYEEYAKQVMLVHKSISKNEGLDIIVIGHRYDLCQLAFAGKGQPKVYGYWNKEQEINSQYDIWSQNKKYGEKNALIVCSVSEKIPESLIKNYQMVKKINQNIRISFPVGKQHHFDLYHAISKNQIVDNYEG